MAAPWKSPFEEDAKNKQELVRYLLMAIGEDPDRPGLAETPGRVVRSWGELYAGYCRDPASLFKIFEEEASDEMVLVKDIEFYSTCEHHLQPFFGKAHIAYIPKEGRVIGVSKLARLLDVYARRLQIQERLTRQITNALMLPEHKLAPLGAACVIEAKHFCMVCRGIAKQNSIMVTSSLAGVFRERPEVRQEFMNLIKGQ